MATTHKPGVPMTVRAIAYGRVSTGQQAEHGISLEAQEMRLRAWGTFHGRQVLYFQDAGISGAKSDRPGFLAALTEVRPGDALVVYSLSRLARSTQDLLQLAEDLEKRKVDLVSLTEQIDTSSAAGRLFFRIMASLSEFERELTSERTAAALQAKKARGERAGQVPWGFRLGPDGRSLLEDMEEQKTIAEAHRLRKQGLSFAKIAAALTQGGHRPRGRYWHPQTVARMVSWFHGFKPD